MVVGLFLLSLWRIIVNNELEGTGESIEAAVADATGSEVTTGPFSTVQDIEVFEAPIQTECTFRSFQTSLPNLQTLVVHEDVPITSVCRLGLANLRSLQRVSIPSCLELGERALSASGRTGIILELQSLEYIGIDCFQAAIVQGPLSFPNLRTIDDGAFYVCYSFDSFEGPAVTRIGQFSFNSCFFDSISLPKCTYAGEFAFGGAVVDRLELPLVTDLREHCFAKMAHLEYTSTPLIDRIPRGCYAYASKLKQINMKPILSIGDSAFVAANISCLDLSFVEEVGARAFKAANGPSNIAMNKVKVVGDFAFDGCQSIRTFTSSSATKLGMGCFAFCSFLNYISIPSVTEAGRGVFMGCLDLMASALLISDTVVPSYIFEGMYIGETRTFYQTSIGDGAFMGCPDIEMLKLPLCLELGSSAAEGCQELQYVSIPKVQSISDGVFRNCPRLSELVLPSSEDTTSGLVLGAEVFKNCTSLREFRCVVVTSIGASCFDGTGLSIFELPNIVNISDRAFRGTSITAAVFENVECVGEYAFESCTNLVTLSLPPSITTLSEGICFNCPKLSEVITNATVISAHAFEGCIALSSFDCSSVESLLSACFKGCQGIVEISLPSVVTLNGDEHFSGCVSLTTIHLPVLRLVSVDSRHIFEGCVSLKRIDLPSFPPSEFADDVFVNTHIETSGSTVPITLCLAKDLDYANYSTSGSQWKHLASQVPKRYTEVCAGYSEVTGHGLTGGQIAAITFGVILLVGLIVATVFVVRYFIAKRYVIYETSRDNALTKTIINDFG